MPARTQGPSKRNRTRRSHHPSFHRCPPHDSRRMRSTCRSDSRATPPEASARRGVSEDDLQRVILQAARACDCHEFESPNARGQAPPQAHPRRDSFQPIEGDDGEIDVRPMKSDDFVQHERVQRAAERCRGACPAPLYDARLESINALLRDTSLFVDDSHPSRSHSSASRTASALRRAAELRAQVDGTRKRRGPGGDHSPIGALLRSRAGHRPSLHGVGACSRSPATLPALHRYRHGALVC